MYIYTVNYKNKKHFFFSLYIGIKNAQSPANGLFLAPKSLILLLYNQRVIRANLPQIVFKIKVLFSFKISNLHAIFCAKHPPQKYHFSFKINDLHCFFMIGIKIFVPKKLKFSIKLRKN